MDLTPAAPRRGRGECRVIIVVNRLRVPSGAGERLEQGFRHAADMRSVPGCLGFELWRSPDGSEYQAVTRWESREAFEGWRQSEAFRHAHRDTRAGEGVAAEVAEFEVVSGV